MKQFPESLKVHKNISTGNNSTGEDTELDGVQPFFLSIIWKYLSFFVSINILMGSRVYLLKLNVEIKNLNLNLFDSETYWSKNK